MALLKLTKMSQTESERLERVVKSTHHSFGGPKFPRDHLGLFTTSGNSSSWDLMPSSGILGIRTHAHIPIHRYICIHIIKNKKCKPQILHLCTKRKELAGMSTQAGKGD